MDAVSSPAVAPAVAPGVAFREVQRRPHTWMRWTWFGLYVGLLVFGWGTSRSSPGDTLPRTFYALFLGGIAYMILGREVLVTEIRDGTLHVSFRHGFSRHVPLSSIRSADEVSYYAGIDGGFGVRNGRAVRVRVDDAVDPLVIGTSRPDELVAALRAPRVATGVGA